MNWSPFRSKEFHEVIALFNHRDKIKLGLLLSFQIVLSVLDLAGIAIFGLLGALAVNGVSYKAPGSRLLQVLELLNIEKFDFRIQVAILGLLATALLVIRTILAIYFTRKTLRFLGKKSAEISRDLFISQMNRDYLAIKELTLNEWVVGLTKGVNSITVKIVGGLITILADCFLLVFIFFGLLFYDFQIAVLTLVIFSSVGFAMFILIRNKAHYLGKEDQGIELILTQKIVESISAYREIYLRNDQQYFGKLISSLRHAQVKTQTNLSFFPLLSRYVFEAMLVVGTLLVGAVQFLLYDAVKAVAALSIFMAASSRIAPAVMRIQQSAVVLKASLGSSQITLKLLSQVGNLETRPSFESLEDSEFTGDIEIENLYFSYPDRENSVFSNLNLSFKAGEFVAILGPTGSGKTTLVDLILGVLTPISGTVRISSKLSRQAVISWPGKISYVPQKIVLFNASLRENLALGSLLETKSDEEIWSALSKAELSDFVNDLPGKLDFQISDMGTNLSGGQVQRIGIARALLASPKILIMDEATSSLDGETEAAIGRLVNKLSSDVTVLVVAHRLSTIRNAKRVIYLDRGEILSDGSISHVRREVPSFDKLCDESGI